MMLIFGCQSIMQDWLGQQNLISLGNWCTTRYSIREVKRCLEKSILNLMLAETISEIILPFPKSQGWLYRPFWRRLKGPLPKVGVGAILRWAVEKDHLINIIFFAS